MLRAMSFDDALRAHYPGALSAERFVVHSQRELAKHGFDEANTIACVGTCRDELCVPLRRAVMNAWGEAFNFSSLAGMLLLGTAGFKAAHAHAPVVGGRERYLYVAMPHIGIAEDGSIGTARRVGREGDSTLCGALVMLGAELAAGPLSLEEDADNPELTQLRRKLAPHLQAGTELPLVELTGVAQRVIEQDLERLIELTVDTASADYAVLTGVQVHAPGGRTFVHPGLSYACVRGARHELPTPG